MLFIEVVVRERAGGNWYFCSPVGKQAEKKPHKPKVVDQFICHERYSSDFHASISREFEHHFLNAGR